MRWPISSMRATIWFDMLSKRVCLRGRARVSSGPRRRLAGRGGAHLLEQVRDEGGQVLGVGRRFRLHCYASPPRVFQNAWQLSLCCVHNPATATLSTHVMAERCANKPNGNACESRIYAI